MIHMKRPKQIPPKRAPIKWIDEATVSISPHVVTLFGEDARGRGVEITFSPYQAIRFTDSECFSGPFPDSGSFGQINEVPNSKWLREVRRALKQSDETADYLDQGKHFVLMAREIVIEIIASEWSLKES
jgi:hypothetical protein